MSQVLSGSQGGRVALKTCYRPRGIEPQVSRATSFPGQEGCPKKTCLPGHYCLLGMSSAWQGQGHMQSCLLCPAGKERGKQGSVLGKEAKIVSWEQRALFSENIGLLEIASSVVSVWS